MLRRSAQNSTKPRLWFQQGKQRDWSWGQNPTAASEDPKHHILLFVMHPQHQELISSPASASLWAFGKASSALLFSISLQTGDWNVLRHNAEEATEISAAPEAAQFWNAAAKTALSARGCKTDHPPSCFLLTPRTEAHPSMLQTALGGLKTVPPALDRAGWTSFGQKDFMSLLQSFTFIEEIQEWLSRGAPGLWEKGVEGAQLFPSCLRTVIGGFS